MEQIIDMFTVLAAENNIHPETSVCTILKKQFMDDCTLLEARSAREFYHHFEAHTADLIILDMEMPGISCSELIPLLRRESENCILLLIADLNTFDPARHPNEISPDEYLFKPYTESEVVLTLEECLHLCSRGTEDASRDGADTADSESETLTRALIVKKKIQQYIHENYNTILSMQDVAQAMNYSDTHFCRLFKQCFHVNFSVYLNEYRIEQAKKLLIYSNKTVKEISIACGYRDTSYFIRVFKRFTGATPSDFRIYEQTMTAKKSNKS